MQVTTSLFGLAAIALSSSALAGTGQQGQVGLADLRQKCTDILANPQMVQPTITLKCDQHKYEWRLCKTNVPMTGNTTVNSTLGMKDWQVEHAQNFDAASQGDCIQYQK